MTLLEAAKQLVEAIDALPEGLEGHFDDAFAEKIANARQAIAEAKKQEPEFIKHEVENTYDWSEWVCPDPKGYLMKCCDCGLVHEAEFGVVRYKSETEREECEPVDDPNLQAVFRMRRSEEWTPEDMAYRPGGLSLEQPAQQEPVAWMDGYRNIYSLEEKAAGCPEATIALVPMANHEKTFGSPIKELNCICGAVWEGDELVHLPDLPQSMKTLTDEEIEEICWTEVDQRLRSFARAIEAKLKEKNT